MLSALLRLGDFISDETLASLCASVRDETPADAAEDDEDEEEDDDDADEGNPAQAARAAAFQKATEAAKARTLCWAVVYDFSHFLICSANQT